MRSPLEAQRVEVLDIRISSSLIEISYATSFSDVGELRWKHEFGSLEDGVRFEPTVDVAVLVFLLEMAPSWYKSTHRDVYIHLPEAIPEDVVTLFFIVFGFERKTAHRFRFAETTYRPAKAISPKTGRGTAAVLPPLEEPAHLSLDVTTSVNDQLVAALFRGILDSIVSGRSVLKFDLPGSCFWTISSGFRYHNSWPGHPRFLDAVRRAMLAVFDVRINIVNSQSNRHVLDIIGDDLAKLHTTRTFVSDAVLFDEMVLLTAVTLTQGLSAARAHLDKSASPILQDLISDLTGDSYYRQRVAMIDVPWSLEPYFPLLAQVLRPNRNKAAYGAGLEVIDWVERAQMPGSEFLTRVGVARAGLNTWMLPNWGLVG